MISLYRWMVMVVCLVLSVASYGQLAQNLTLGNAKALALANAVTADPPGIDAIHFNPAGLTRLKGKKVNLKVVAGQFTITSELTRGEYVDGLLKEFDFFN